MTSSQRNARAADVTLHLSCCCCSPLRGLPASNRNRSTGGYASRDGDDDALSYPARAESRRRCGPTWPPHRRRDEPDRLCARRRLRQEKLPGRAVAVAHHRQQRNARKKKKFWPCAAAARPPASPLPGFSAFPSALARREPPLHWHSSPPRALKIKGRGGQWEACSLGT